MLLTRAKAHAKSQTPIPTVKDGDAVKAVPRVTNYAFLQQSLVRACFARVRAIDKTRQTAEAETGEKLPAQAYIFLRRQREILEYRFAKEMASLDRDRSKYRTMGYFYKETQRGTLTNHTKVMLAALEQSWNLKMDQYLNKLMEKHPPDVVTEDVESGDEQVALPVPD